MSQSGPVLSAVLQCIFIIFIVLSNYLIIWNDINSGISRIIVGNKNMSYECKPIPNSSLKYFLNIIFISISRSSPNYTCKQWGRLSAREMFSVRHCFLMSPAVQPPVSPLYKMAPDLTHRSPSQPLHQDEPLQSKCWSWVPSVGRVGLTTNCLTKCWSCWSDY